ncbi:SDR family NAD(P)-dependent oxidoreductase [Streptomyces sp. NPDC050560]|uniref:SDR family NAD(P)-dependent oxidoreductase n=1 Tax=Streptomyces sp. NPDC050560 TaxID=3365630 RepID=UPI0037AB8BDD
MQPKETNGGDRAVAIVGVSCRLPGGVEGLEGLWEALREGRELTGPVPADRFEAPRFVDTAQPRLGKSYTGTGGFLDDIASFDAGYFGISPKEAPYIDPQHRLLLELAAEALDDAAVAPAALAGGDTAVYVGISDGSYIALQDPRDVGPYSMTGAASSIAANRLSYAFDLRGPSMAVDTACSSSLVALDRACRTLLDGTSRTALCAGANLVLSPVHYIGFSQASMLSRTGRTSAFSARADGFVRAEGGGAVLLKPLADALADGDRVRGVILGTGSNCDGRTMGLALPSSEAQEELLRRVYAEAGVDPDELVYFEAHGTGTPVGDPAEARAVGRALGMRRMSGELPIGSVKTNLGHLEPASGMAGLCKALLVLEHHTAPPSLHGEPAHPDIDFAGLGLSLTTATRPLARVPRPVVGVNSFGFGGANAHVIVAAPPAPAPAGPVSLPAQPRAQGPAVPRPTRGGHTGGVPAEAAAPQAPAGAQGPLPFLVSARTAGALTEAMARAGRRLADAAPDEFYDLAHTACLRRGLHEFRAAVVAGSAAEAAAALTAQARAARATPAAAAEPGADAAAGPVTAPGAPAGPQIAALPETAPGTHDAPQAAAQGPDAPPEGAALPPVRTARAVRRGQVAFVFSGNGSQWRGMGADLLGADPVFRGEVERVDAALAPLLGWSVAEELARPARTLEATEHAQPLLFAVQAGLTAAVRAAGFEPSMVLGHSVGEVAAAYAAGALTLAQAALVVAERSRVQAPLAGGGRMAAVGLPPEEAAAVLASYDGALEVAGRNSPADTTVAGDTEALAALGTQLRARGVFFRDLGLDYAFHSAAMDGARDPLARALEALAPAEGAVPLYSTVTGAQLPGTELDAAYWWENVRRPVLFADAVAAAAADGADVFLEIGPHPVLRGCLSRSAEGAAVLPTLHRDVRGAAAEGAVTAATAALLASGVGVDAARWFPRPGRVVDLPAYPWQRQRHWVGGPGSWSRPSGGGAFEHPLLGRRVPAPHPVWEGAVEPVLVPWLADHRIGGLPLMPATGFVDMALSAGRLALGGEPVEAEYTTVTSGLAVPWEETGGVTLHLSLRPDDGTVAIASTDATTAAPRPHATARVRVLRRPRPAPLDLDALRARCPARVAADEFYAATAAVGLQYGPGFQVLHELYAGEGESLVGYRHPAPGAPYVIHPAVLDGALQAGVQLLRDRLAAGQVFLPARLGAVRVWGEPPAEGAVWARERDRTDDEVCWDLVLTDPAGRVFAEVEGCRLRRAPARTAVPVTVHHTVLRAAPHPGVPLPPMALPSPADTLAALPMPPHEPRPEGLDAFKEFGARQWARALAARLPAPFTIADLAATGMHTARAEALVALMARHGLLAGEPGDGWRVAGEAADPEEAGQRCLAVAPGLVGALAVAAEAAPAPGAVPPTPGLRHHHRLAARLLAAALEGRPADRPLRVLETGAGSGELTAALLPLLPADATRYLFTDTGSAHFPAARARFAGYDFVEYRECPGYAPGAGAEGEPGLPEGGFDLLVTGQAPAPDALPGLVALLAPGGRLLCLPTHDAELLALLGELPEHPVVPRAEWPALLAGHGFTDVALTGDDDQHSVVLAALPDEPADGRALCDAPADQHRPAEPGLTHAPRGAVYVLLAEDDRGQPLLDALAADLRGRGAAVAARAPGELPGADALAGPAGQPTDVVLLLSPGAEGADGGQESVTRRIAALGALAAAQRAGAPPARFWLVTGPHAGLPAPAGESGLADAAAWAAARCLSSEHPDLEGRRISLARGAEPAADAARLARELLAPGAEDEIVLSPRGRFVPRERGYTARERRAGGGKPADAAPFGLVVRDPGLSYELAWADIDMPRPGPGEVAVRVRAVGLNYRDVMQCTGLLPREMCEGTFSEKGPGVEFAGEVTACGPGVTEFAPGDRVSGCAAACLATHTVAPVAGLMRVPDAFTFAEAATLPVAALTVHYGLGHLAHLAAGETVLVHGAAGAVGIAALRYARRVGARAIATAGTPRKRALLRALGVQDVLDSRSLDFAEEVREATGGAGVDVVLNSLAGEALARSLELLRPGGRFVELGKRDIHENRPLALRPFDNNIGFFGMDISKLLGDPAFARRLAAELAAELAVERHRGLPHTAFPAARVAEAFTLLQHSRHIGKVVVTFDDTDEPPLVEARPAPPAADPAGTYLVTGGTGGFGAASASWLAGLGARHLALVGRAGPGAPGATELLAALAARGVAATAYAADVTDPEAVRGVLAAIDATGRPLRGVVHAAMLLDDAPLADLTPERTAAVLAPKLRGAALLDALTADRDLDLFLLYSSGTALFGNVKQAPYVAANAYLEALARRRRAAGRPALAVAWGALGETGYVARTGLARHFEGVGIGLLSPREAFAAAELLLGTGADVAGAGRYDWRRVGALVPTETGARLRELVPEDAGPAGLDREEMLRELRGLSADAALTRLTEELTELIAATLQMDPADLDPDQRLDSFGLDSLMGTHLLASIQGRYDIQIPFMELLSSEGTVRGLSRLTHQRLGLSTPPPPPAAVPGPREEEAGTIRA